MRPVEHRLPQHAMHQHLAHAQLLCLHPGAVASVQRAATCLTLPLRHSFTGNDIAAHVHTSWWNAVFTWLTENGVDCHSFDMRSFGKSDTDVQSRGKIATFDQPVGDYMAFCDRVQAGAHAMTHICFAGLLDKLSSNFASAPLADTQTSL